MYVAVKGGERAIDNAHQLLDVALQWANFDRRDSHGDWLRPGSYWLGRGLN